MPLNHRVGLYTGLWEWPMAHGINHKIWLSVFQQLQAQGYSLHIYLGKWWKYQISNVFHNGSHRINNWIVKEFRELILLYVYMVNQYYIYLPKSISFKNRIKLER